MSNIFKNSLFRKINFFLHLFILIFYILDILYYLLVVQGIVSFRDYRYETSFNLLLNKNIHRKSKKEEKLKTKLCFFNENHPEGCVLTVEECHFAHGISDLKSWYHSRVFDVEERERIVLACVLLKICLRKVRKFPGPSESTVL